jgi:H+-transporting ATPase
MDMKTHLRAGIISSILGVLLAVGTWILRGTLFLGVWPGSNIDDLGGVIEGTHGVVQNFGNIQGILFLEVALTENWLYVVALVS